MEISKKSVESFVSKNPIIVYGALALIIFFGGAQFQMLTESSSVTCELGDTVNIPYTFVYNEDFFFGDSSYARVDLKTYSVSDTGSRTLMSTQTIWADNVFKDTVYKGSYSFKPPAAGDYKLSFAYVANSNTGAGDFDVMIHVTPSSSVDSTTGTVEDEVITTPEEEFATALTDYIYMWVVKILGWFGVSV